MGGGVVLASIAGNNNLSLQNWTADSTIPTSITFSGDNTEYNGTLYLHPSIDSIIFASKESIIKNINFPQPDDESRREVHLTFEDSTNDIRTLTISDNLTCNIQGSINLNTLNLNNTNALKFFNSSNINLGNSSGAIVNISSEKYTERAKPVLQYIVSAKYDYDKDKCLYYYPDKVLCTKCNTETDITTLEPWETLLSNDDIKNTLPTAQCKKCHLSSFDIILQAYLYPKFIDMNGQWCEVYCSVCRDENGNGGWLMSGMFYFDSNNNKFSGLNLWNDRRNDHTNCMVSNNNLIYDSAYVLEQLNKGYRSNKIEIWYAEDV